ncbi:putative actin-binding protein Fragmin [Xylariomycetidae sp. FL2044]|nr:putative actin-binding protein Fragmin [Xylariomycetidae sp. FL2044]
MPPHEGLVHTKEYDWRDSNVEAIGTDLDHKVKYNSAATEPAWQEVGQRPGLHVWRIEDFQVVPWPRDRYGDFHEGDSYIVLHTIQVGNNNNNSDDDGADSSRLVHDIFFWLGSRTSQDEAGVAAYKTVELDEWLRGAAAQHRELQREPSDDFVALFPRIRILSGGVRSGFTHVDDQSGEGADKAKETSIMLLRVFKHPSAAARRADSIMVHEVTPTWRSLDENDVFVLERADKIWVWQGRNCSPMEKAKAAQVVHDMTVAKHVEVEVLSQAESRSRAVVAMLGGDDDDGEDGVGEGPLTAPRPIVSSTAGGSGGRTRKLFRLSDASGQLRFDLVKEEGGSGNDNNGDTISRSDLDSGDVFVLDTGSSVWVWQGAGASRAEKAMWIRVAESYVRQLAEGSEEETTYLTPISKVVEGYETPAFRRAIAA